MTRRLEVHAPARRVRWLRTRDAVQLSHTSRHALQRLARADALTTRQDGDSPTSPREYRACCVRAQSEREACGVCAGEHPPHPDDVERIGAHAVAWCESCGKRAMGRTADQAREALAGVCGCRP